MKFIIFIISAYILGGIAAIPTGPVQIEVIKRAISGHLKSSLMVVLGATISDLTYGFIAFFGIAPFLRDKKVMAIFWLAGGSLLILLGILTIRQSLVYTTFNESRYLRRKRWALIGGFSISATNPMMILWWLIGARIFMDIGLIEDFNTNTALSFLVAGGLGLSSYLVFLSLFLFWMKRFIPERKIRYINLAFGVILLFIATYFIYTSLHSFEN
jgi:threonine/homoserine/homoserine lactone efflux protein